MTATDGASEGESSWADRLAAVAARQVRRYRTQQGLSAADLSTRCAELGYPIQRNVLLKIEGGYRRYLTTAEWLILAAALRVPPGALLLPLGETAEFELLPGRTVPTDEAAEHLLGVGSRSMLFEGTSAAGASAFSWLYDFSQHHALVRDLQRALALATDWPDEQERERHSRTAEVDLRRLANLRANMRAHGAVPPALPDNMTEHGGDLTAWGPPADSEEVRS